MSLPAQKHVPVNTNQGWPVVGLVVFLAVACIVFVTVVHNRTYKHPTDPTYAPRAGAAEAAH